MNSLGDSSKWLQFSSSFPLSESEQTEDEADVFSEEEAEHGKRHSFATNDRIILSGGYGNVHLNPDRLDLYPSDAKCLKVAARPESAALCPSSVTPGDLAFAQKCADLHRFIHPLFELLQGLKTGRFDKGLTSFQQTVAIDRLQRILGILQKPEMGEKYLQNLLQIEMLLKMWFPQRPVGSTAVTNQSSTPAITLHRYQNQRNIPVKKRKLSWADPDVPGRLPAKHNPHQQGEHEPGEVATSLHTCLPLSPDNQPTPEEERVKLVGRHRPAGHTVAGRTGPSHRSHDGSLGLPDTSVAPSCGSPATQDCSVSSSNGLSATDAP